MSQPLSYITKSPAILPKNEDYYLKGFVSTTQIIYRVHGIYLLKLEDEFSARDFVEEHGIIDDIDTLFPVIKFSEMSNSWLINSLGDTNLFLITFNSNNSINHYKMIRNDKFTEIKNLTNFFIYLCQRLELT